MIDWYYKRRTNGRTVLHYARFTDPEHLLYASENDEQYTEKGWYWDGEYPVVVDALFPEKGSPMGFGYIDIARDPQLYIDKLWSNILETSLINTKRRFLVSESVNVNEDELRDVIRQGTLTLGFIGLAECLKALTGAHHGESDEAQQLGLRIVRHMRRRMDEASEQYGLNFSLIATPAEGLSGRFTRLDAARFGKIPGVTDRAYYTNSFHVPVYYPINVFDKIAKEAPYHAMTNGGHISYVEFDGLGANNPDAFEAVVRAMKEAGIGYGSINHPVDRDPLCGYTGVIAGERCPKCGRRESDGPVGFERIRRITGYLVGSLERFNDAKRAEVKDRVVHGMGASHSPEQ